MGYLPTIKGRPRAATDDSNSPTKLPRHFNMKSSCGRTLTHPGPRDIRRLASPKSTTGSTLGDWQESTKLLHQRCKKPPVDQTALPAATNSPKSSHEIGLCYSLLQNDAKAAARTPVRTRPCLPAVGNNNNNNSPKVSSHHSPEHPAFRRVKFSKNTFIFIVSK